MLSLADLSATPALSEGFDLGRRSRCDRRREIALSELPLGRVQWCSPAMHGSGRARLMDSEHPETPEIYEHIDSDRID